MSYRDDPAFLFELRFRLYRKEYGPSNVTIRAWEAPAPDHYRRTGHTRLDAELLWNGEVICKRGGTYCGIPAGHTIDGDYAKEAVAALFCESSYLRDDDGTVSGEETDRLVEWIAAHGETLGCEKTNRYGEP